MTDQPKSVLLQNVTYNRHKALHPSAHNAKQVLKALGAKFWFNEITGKIYEGDKVLTDDDLAVWYLQLQSKYMPELRQAEFDSAARHLARQDCKNPMQDWLNGLGDNVKNNGGMTLVRRVEELSGWLHRWWGVEDSSYYRQLSIVWMVGLVSRALHPGCHMDMMMVLEGPQGIGKSRWCHGLVTPTWEKGDTSYYLCCVPGKDRSSLMSMRGKMLIELDEMNRYTRRTTADELKSFISESFDSYREPYAKLDVTVDRTFVVVGTTNDREWLQDATGNRRMWPVVLDRVIDWDRFVEERDMVLGCAVLAYREGVKCNMELDEGSQAELTGLRNERMYATGLEEFLERIVGQKGLIGIGYTAIRDLLMDQIMGIPEYRGSEVDSVRVLNRAATNTIKKGMLKIGWECTGYRLRSDAIGGTPLMFTCAGDKRIKEIHKALEGKMRSAADPKDVRPMVFESDIQD